PRLRGGQRRVVTLATSYHRRTHRGGQDEQEARSSALAPPPRPRRAVPQQADRAVPRRCPRASPLIAYPLRGRNALNCRAFFLPARKLSGSDATASLSADDPGSRFWTIRAEVAR